MLPTLLVAIGFAVWALCSFVGGDLNHALALIGLSLLADAAYELERIRMGRR